MKKLLINGMILFYGMAISFTNAHAIEEAKVPEEQRSTIGLYFTSSEASAYMIKHAKATLFLDVRDPVEIFTVGMPMVVDANIPFKRIDIHKWNKKKRTYAMVRNAAFFSEVEARLKSKGLNKNSPIIVICGSGIRSAQAASALKKYGYTHVYSVIYGYAAWQEAGLAWSKKFQKEKMYGNPKE